MRLGFRGLLHDTCSTTHTYVASNANAIINEEEGIWKDPVVAPCKVPNEHLPVRTGKLGQLKAVGLWLDTEPKIAKKNEA
jgi:hypothetical protein